jgi:hypothetical protein
MSALADSRLTCRRRDTPCEAAREHVVILARDSTVTVSIQP